MDATVCGDLCQSLCFRVYVCACECMCVGEKEEGLYFSRKVWFIIARNLKESQCFPTLITKFSIHLKARVPTHTHLPTDKTLFCFFFVFFKRSQRWSMKMCTVNLLVLEHICILCDVINVFYLWGGAYGGLFRVRSCKSHSFLPSGGGNHHHSGTGMSWFLLLHFSCAICFSLLLFLYSVTPLCVFTYSLEHVKRYSALCSPKVYISCTYCSANKSAHLSKCRMGLYVECSVIKPSIR